MFMRTQIDPFNKLGHRNIGNTPRRDFNCGGYALGTFNWYKPVLEENEDEEDLMFDSEIDVYERTQRCVNAMLMEFAGVLRVINDVSELMTDEYAIAFRLQDGDGWDDFHYMKRASNGVWYQKCGGYPTIFRATKHEALYEEWSTDVSYTYYGPVVLFAKKN